MKEWKKYYSAHQNVQPEPILGDSTRKRKPYNLDVSGVQEIIRNFVLRNILIRFSTYTHTKLTNKQIKKFNMLIFQVLSEPLDGKIFRYLLKPYSEEKNTSSQRDRLTTKLVIVLLYSYCNRFTILCENRQT